MTNNADPGAIRSVDESLEEALARLPEDARLLAAQALKAARYASQTQYSYLGGLVNMRVHESDDGNSVLEMDVTPNALNGYGYVHGGMLFTLADYAMGAAARSLVPKGSSPVTLEAKVNFLGNVKEGRVVARCQALHQGKHLIMMETRLHEGDSDELIAIVTGTFYIIEDEEG